MEESKSKIPAELKHFSRMIEDSCVFDSAMDATENLLIALRHGNVSKIILCDVKLQDDSVKNTLLVKITYLK